MSIILEFVFRYFPKLEVLWYALLPWLAYGAILFLDPSISRPTGSTILIGWAFLLVYQIMRLGQIEHIQDDKKLAAVGTDATSGKALAIVPSELMLFIPSVLIAIQQILLGGNLAHFLITQMCVEICTFVLAIAVLMLTAKNNHNRSAWQDLGIIPLMFVAILWFGVWGYINAWIKILYLPGSSLLSFVLLLASLAFNFWNDYKFLYKVVKREILMSDASEKMGMGGILGQLVLWVALPGLFYLWRQYV